MGRMNNLMQTVTICQEFGWTYEEYQSQPSFFIQAIKEKMLRDQKEQERAVKRHGKRN